MKKVEVEIYSDTSNNAVMKHPGRQFPGSLIQGDSLYTLYRMIERTSDYIDKNKYDEAQEGIDEVRELLLDRLNHYKQILKDHDIQLPFYEEKTD